MNGTTVVLGWDGLDRTLVEEYDLLFVWLGFVDTVGHLAPIAGSVDSGWQERTYRLAADWTRELRAALGADDRLLCVSDHGIREGHHTPTRSSARPTRRSPSPPSPCSTSVRPSIG